MSDISKANTSKADRRAAIDAYKERTSDWAICAIRIGDHLWLKAVADPAAFERRMSFTLRTGSALTPDMAEAFRHAGQFTLDVLERLDPELSDMARETAIKDRLAHWAQDTGGRAL